MKIINFISYLIIVVVCVAWSPCTGVLKTTKKQTQKTHHAATQKLKRKKQHPHKKRILLAQNSAPINNHSSFHEKTFEQTETTTAANTTTLAESREAESTEEEYDQTSSQQSHFIRVLLEEYRESEPIKLLFKSNDGFVLESPAGSNTTAIIQENELKLLVKDNSIYLKCSDDKYRRIKHSDLEICSPYNKITFKNQTYQGTVRVCFDEGNKTTFIINKLDLEDYVYSVVRHEAIPSWPLEMHKVQAIASRTYALYHMKHTRAKSAKKFSPYDIKNNHSHQIYNGTHEMTHLRRAVEETRNVVLTYHGDFALTMFDICCGGIVPGFMRNKDVSKPYLCRTTPCLFCKNTAYYVWQESVSAKNMLALLKDHPRFTEKFKNFGNKIIDIQVTAKDKAGVVYKVKLAGARNNVVLSGQDIKSVLQGKLKSTAFSIKKNSDRLTFVGRGNSHFNGLCQWGAKELVDRGWNYKEILSFYYPKTQLSRLI